MALNDVCVCLGLCISEKQPGAAVPGSASCLMEMLGTELRSSMRAACAGGAEPSLQAGAQGFLTAAAVGFWDCIGLCLFVYLFIYVCI